MSFDIDITEKKSRELIKILDLYPYGRLEIKYERVFWCSDSSEPELPRRSPGDSPENRGAPLKKENAHTKLTRSLDALGSMMGSPGR